MNTSKENVQDSLNRLSSETELLRAERDALVKRVKRLDFAVTALETELKSVRSERDLLDCAYKTAVKTKESMKEARELAVKAARAADQQSAVYYADLLKVEAERTKLEDELVATKNRSDEVLKSAHAKNEQVIKDYAAYRKRAEDAMTDYIEKVSVLKSEVSHLHKLNGTLVERIAKLTGRTDELEQIVGSQMAIIANLREELEEAEAGCSPQTALQLEPGDTLVSKVVIHDGGIIEHVHGVERGAAA